MYCNFGEIIKKLYFLVWWKARQMATQATPPPLREPLPHIFHVLDGKCEIYLRESLGGGGGGGGDLGNGAIR
jgi:hypothetical protein